MRSRFRLPRAAKQFVTLFAERQRLRFLAVQPRLQDERIVKGRRWRQTPSFHDGRSRVWRERNRRSRRRRKPKVGNGDATIIRGPREKASPIFCKGAGTNLILRLARSLVFTCAQMQLDQIEVVSAS
jgi:hypothetical protein